MLQVVSSQFAQSHFAHSRFAQLFFPFRPLPSRPLPISPFTILPLCHLAQSSFCPLTISPFYQFTLCRFAQCHLAPIISPLHHFAHCHISSRPFIISSRCFSFTETADYSTRFPSIGAQTVTWYRVKIQSILAYSFLEELKL